MNVTINGQLREFPQLEDGASLGRLIEALELKSDRVAVELNSSIVAREQWTPTGVRSGDRLEIVHFVGGGC